MASGHSCLRCLAAAGAGIWRAAAVREVCRGISDTLDRSWASVCLHMGQQAKRRSRLAVGDASLSEMPGGGGGAGMRGVLAGRGIESIRRGISDTLGSSRARLCAYFGGCSKMVEVPRWRMCPAGSQRRQGMRGISGGQRHWGGVARH